MKGGNGTCSPLLLFLPLLLQVRLPDGDSIVLDDDGDDLGSGGGRSKVSQRGEIIDAEFRELN